MGLSLPRPEKYMNSSIGMIIEIPNIYMGKFKIDGNQTTNQTIYLNMEI